MDGSVIPRPKPSTVTLSVNDSEHTLLIEPRTHLADALREQLNLTGTHVGCEQGVCGACTVLIDGVPQRSCIAYAVDCEGSRVTTIEGFDADETMASLREAFSAHHALQCGFCTSGMLITARDIVLRLGEVDEARIREELSGNLCRCTGYVGIVNAVCAVVTGRKPQSATPAALATPLVSRTARSSAAAPAHSPAQPVLSRASGGTMLEEVVQLAIAPDAAWAALSDLRRVAGCVPGVQLDSLEGDRVIGRVRLAFGPIKANFSGEGRISVEETSRTGRLNGGGRDGASRAEGDMTWTVAPSLPGGSVVTIRLWWRLTGPLSQFGRVMLVQDLVRRVAQEFARNLEGLVTGEAPLPAHRLGLFKMLWALLRARLFAC
jgi:aerobic-type carbon monoxide dehydrogenase small subunit (CoxS/CutS family)/carbon monoxide dehydrogenase subunit G